MTIEELVQLFERIHPSERELVFNPHPGKNHWITLDTIPRYDDVWGDLASVPRVHLERGHGTADAMGHFFIAAMQFAKEALEKRWETLDRTSKEK